ncbi:hypothetical protein [Sphingobacterium multivorum]|uniref:hypothetical protein n=1 Tax=Sphingobacterium multivorum TaxID=28454 RepID=UPI00289EBFE6|nr:hypothetical protein [Sphingobacterium multivorum]
MKRYIKPVFVSLMAATLFMESSCTKDFDKINTDPVAYGKENWDPNYTLSSAQLFYTGSFDFAYMAWKSDLFFHNDARFIDRSELLGWGQIYAE